MIGVVYHVSVDGVQGGDCWIFVCIAGVLWFDGCGVLLDKGYGGVCVCVCLGLWVDLVFLIWRCL